MDASDSRPRIDGGESHRKLARQSAITIATYALIVLIRIAKNGIVSRVLGPSARGVFGLVMLIPDLMAALGNMGVGPAIVYYVAKKNHDLRQVIQGAFLFAGVMGGILIAASAVVLNTPQLYRESAETLLQYDVYILLAIAVVTLQALAEALLIGKGMVKTLNAVWLGKSGLALVLFLVLLVMWPEDALRAAVVSWFIGTLIMTIVPFAPLWKFCSLSVRGGADFLRLAFRYGMASHWANVFTIAQRRIDYLFIAALLPPKDLGYYAIATSICELLLLVPDAVAVPFVPLVFGMNREDSTRFTPMVIKTVFAIMVVSCLGTALIGLPLILLIFGRAYVPAFASLLFLLPGMVALGLFPVVKGDLFGRNLPGRCSIISGIALAACVILNCALIPRWGIEGAAISSSLSYSLSVFLLYLAYCRESGNSFWRTLFFSREESGRLARYSVKKLKKYTGGGAGSSS